MITVIVGTNRPESNSFKIGKLYMEELKSQGVDAQMLQLEDLAPDFIHQEMYGRRTAEFEQIIATYIRPITKFVFVIPEYNGSFPGVLKAFIDCVPPGEFHGKKAGLIGLSSGAAGAARAMDQFTSILNYIKVNVLYAKPKLSGIDTLLQDGVLSDERAVTGLRDQAALIKDF